MLSCTAVVPAFVLFLFSLAFYAWGEPVYVILMLVSILVSYTGGLFIDRLKRAGNHRAAGAVLMIASVISLSMLAFFKYGNFVIETVNGLTGAGIDLLYIALPIGISFYTFQTLSYMIDVYRGGAPVQKNPIAFGTYITMFPQLIAGPIVQYKTIAPQLHARKETMAQFAESVHRFMIGLGKKSAADRHLAWGKLELFAVGDVLRYPAVIGKIRFGPLFEKTACGAEACLLYVFRTAWVEPVCV